jgi:hypothetical protein
VSRFLYLAFVVLALAASIAFLESALPRYLPFDWANAHDYDALTDFRSAKLFVHGKSAFSPEGRAAIGIGLNGHPPSTMFWFIPLAGFSKALAAELIGLTVWFGLGIHAYLCAKAVRFPAPIVLTVLVTSFMLTTGGLLMHFQAVQISEHIALCYVAAWWYLRRGEDARGGIALGIAATLKLFPGLLLVLLLFGRRWRAFAAGSLTFLAVAAVVTPVVGFASWFQFLGQQGPIATTWIGHIRNATLQGIVLRLFSPVCTTVAVPTKASTAVATLMALLLLGAAIWASLPRLRVAREKDPTAIDVPFSLFTLLSVFLNPWAWEHYSVFLIQPMFVIGDAAWRQWEEGFLRWRSGFTSHLELVKPTLRFAAGVGVVVASAKMLTLNVVAKERLLELFHSTRRPWYHRYLHLYEVANWLPWVLGIVSCYAILLATRRAPSRAVAISQPPAVSATDPSS